MKIVQLNVHTLRMPLSRPMKTAQTGRQIGHIELSLLTVKTAEGIEGIGFGYSLIGGMSALTKLMHDDFFPLLLGENALDHERLNAKVAARLQTVGRRGIVTQGLSALDLALWDIKGKQANLPVHKLLGGFRESAPMYHSDAGWLYMSVDEMVAEFQKCLAEGMMGVKMKIGHDDPRIDIQRVAEVRKRLGDRAWIAVDANQKFDFPTAIYVGGALESMGIAWFEEPLFVEDIEGYIRLARELRIPIAMGENLGSRREFAQYITRDALDIAQPDICRLGGISETMKVIHLAEIWGKPVTLHHLLDISIVAACGLTAEGAIAYTPWISTAFDPPARIKDGQLLASPEPGLGLKLSERAKKEFVMEHASSSIK